MFFFLIILLLISSVLYFHLLWLWFLSFLLLLFVVGFFVYMLAKSPVSFSKLEIGKYSLYIARSIILFAFLGIFSFLHINFPLSFLWILVGNSVLWVLSQIFSYEDWKKIFQYWYYLFFFLFFIVGFFVFPTTLFLPYFLLLFSLHFWFLWFFTYVIKIWIPIEKSFYYMLFVSGLFLFCLLLVSLIPSLPAALSLISVFLMALYLWFWWFVQRKPIHRWRISVRRILAGERIISQTFFSNTFLTTMSTFVLEMPSLYRYLLEIVNVIVVITLFIVFTLNWSHISGLQHFFYWVVISFFVGNVLLLKKMDYTSFFQNLFLFLVVHFAVYISLFSYFDSHIQSVVLWSVLWNIATSIGLFLLPKKYQYLFSHKDYRYWIVASIMSFLVNVFLLLKSGLAGELIFFLLLLYVGIESMLVFYWIKYVWKQFALEE